MECPGCHERATSVPVSLVRFNVAESWRLELEGDWAFCASTGCPIAYLSGMEQTIEVKALRRAPAYKSREPSDLLCFCFDVSAADSQAAVASIRARVGKRECACDVLNPSGECCLGSIGGWSRAE